MSWLKPCLSPDRSCEFLHPRRGFPRLGPISLVSYARETRTKPNDGLHVLRAAGAAETKASAIIGLENPGEANCVSFLLSACCSQAHSKWRLSSLVMLWSAPPESLMEIASASQGSEFVFMALLHLSAMSPVAQRQQSS